VCISGSCIKDNRKTLCSSTMPCCDTFGNIKNSNYIYI
jgi:hypothetical protein